MAAGLSLSRATITRPDGEPLTKVSIIVRGNVATIRRGHEQIASAEVASVVPLARTEWEVTLSDGQVWHVKRERGG